VNKANNPECQGNANNLRKKESRNQKPTLAKKYRKVAVINNARNSFTTGEGVIERVIDEML
jgi:hypothetical protein